jgi:hypothetical protein
VRNKISRSLRLQICRGREICDTPHGVPGIANYLDGTEDWLLLEYYPNGDLQDRVEKKGVDFVERTRRYTEILALVIGVVQRVFGCVRVTLFVSGGGHVSIGFGSLVNHERAVSAEISGVSPSWATPVGEGLRCTTVSALLTW